MILEWCKKKGATMISENAMLVYFSENVVVLCEFNDHSSIISVYSLQ